MESTAERLENEIKILKEELSGANHELVKTKSDLQASRQAGLLAFEDDLNTQDLLKSQGFEIEEQNTVMSSLEESIISLKKENERLVFEISNISSLAGITDPEVPTQNERNITIENEVEILSDENHTSDIHAIRKADDSSTQDLLTSQGFEIEEKNFVTSELEQNISSLKSDLMNEAQSLETINTDFNDDSVLTKTPAKASISNESLQTKTTVHQPVFTPKRSIFSPKLTTPRKSSALKKMSLRPYSSIEMDRIVASRVAVFSPYAVVFQDYVSAKSHKILKTFYLISIIPSCSVEISSIRKLR